MVKALKKTYSSEELVQVKNLEKIDFGEREVVRGFTIDSKTSRDLDDAIWVETQGEKAIVQVHIADPTEVIPVDSPLDKGIRKRVSSQYWSNGVTPMIPADLSESKLSLLEGSPRLSITVEMELDKTGKLEAVDIFESCLISLAKLSYEKAESISQDVEHELFMPLNQAQLWAKVINAQRRRQGALVGLMKGNFYIDEDGSLKEIAYKSQVLVSEYMILANAAVGVWLAQNSVPGIYRNHLPKENVETTFVRELFSSDFKNFSSQLNHLLSKASYGRESRGHYALALPHYLHFTSPLRRWADFLVHRCLKAFLNDQPIPYSLEEMDLFALEINEFHKIQSEKRHEMFKKQANQKMLKTVKTSGYSSLSKNEFSRLIKLAIRNKRPLNKVRSEIQLRAESSALTNSDYALFLFESNDVELQNLVKEYIQPSHLSGFFNNCPFITKKVRRVEYSDLGTNVDNLEFRSRLFIEFDTKLLTTKLIINGVNKKEAKANASVAWLEAFLNDDLKEVPELIVEFDENNINDLQKFIHPEKITKSNLKVEKLVNKNPVALLNNFCQGSHIKKPSYQYVSEDGVFICTTSVKFKGKVYEGKGVDLTKKGSQKIAADKVLTALNQVSDLRLSKRKR